MCFASTFLTLSNKLSGFFGTAAFQENGSLNPYHAFATCLMVSFDTTSLNISLRVNTFTLLLLQPVDMTVCAHCRTCSCHVSGRIPVCRLICRLPSACPDMQPCHALHGMSHIQTEWSVMLLCQDHREDSGHRLNRESNSSMLLSDMVSLPGNRCYPGCCPLHGS